MAPTYEEWKVMGKQAIRRAAYMPIVKYAGLITGIAGVADGMDPWKIGIGGALYYIAGRFQQRGLLWKSVLQRESYQEHVDSQVAGLKKEIADAKSSVSAMKGSIDDLVKSQK
jgi:hypothetical protein